VSNASAGGWELRYRGFVDTCFASLGPFTHLEMQEWYSNGYFDPQLPIKHPESPVFEPLARFLMRYGEASPFLIEAEEVVRVVSLALITHNRASVLTRTKTHR
jgi:hypothetical protein